MTTHKGETYNLDLQTYLSPLTTVVKCVGGLIMYRIEVPHGSSSIRQMKEKEFREGQKEVYCYCGDDWVLREKL